MYYEDMPLYPQLGHGCDRDACVRVPVFGGGRCASGQMPEASQCRRVTLENPCHPGERVEVLLGVDECGNLVVCVRRDPGRDCDCRPRSPICRPPRPCLPKPCPPDPCPPRPCVPPREGCRGRLYGSWR